MPSGRYQTERCHRCLGSLSNGILRVTCQSSACWGQRSKGKKAAYRATAVLYLPSGYVRAGVWVRWEDPYAPSSFSEQLPGDVAAEVEVIASCPQTKPDGPLPQVSSDLEGHPFPSSLILCISLANREPGNDSVVLLRLGSSSFKSHSREARTHNPNHGGGGRLVLQAFSSCSV